MGPSQNLLLNFKANRMPELLYVIMCPVSYFCLRPVCMLWLQLFMHFDGPDGLRLSRLKACERVLYTTLATVQPSSRSHKPSAKHTPLPHDAQITGYGILSPFPIVQNTLLPHDAQINGYGILSPFPIVGSLRD
jgi:hypothetical protein